MLLIILASLAVAVGLATFCRCEHTYRKTWVTEKAGDFSIEFGIEYPEDRVLEFSLGIAPDPKIQIELWSLRLWLSWNK